MKEYVGYEVVRFVERGRDIHAIIDHVDGITLYEWIAKNRTIEKSRLMHILKDLLKELILFSKQKNHPSYGYLTPYHIILSREDYTLLLCSPQSAGRSERHALDKHFRPPNERLDVDVFCFGKMIQFIMAHVRCVPALNVFEEFYLQRIVMKCLQSNPKKQYDSIESLQKYFKNREQNIRKKKPLLSVGVACLCIVGFLFFQVNGKSDPVKAPPAQELIEEQGEEKEELEQFDEWTPKLFQMGVDYFLDHRNYQKSIDYFDMVVKEEEHAAVWKELALFLLEGRESSEMRWAIHTMEEEVREQSTTALESVIALMRVYLKVGGEEERMKLLALTDEEWIRRQIQKCSLQLQMEFEWSKAKVYEEEEAWDQAEKAYERLCQLEGQQVDRGKTFSEKQMEMQLKHLQQMNEESAAEEHMMLTEIERMLEENPKLQKEKSFLKFLEENDLRIEKGKVTWEKGLKREDAG